MNTFICPYWAFWRELFRLASETKAKIKTTLFNLINMFSVNFQKLIRNVPFSLPVWVPQQTEAKCFTERFFQCFSALISQLWVYKLVVSSEWNRLVSPETSLFCGQRISRADLQRSLFFFFFSFLKCLLRSFQQTLDNAPVRRSFWMDSSGVKFVPQVCCVDFEVCSNWINPRWSRCAAAWCSSQWRKKTF